VKLYQSSRRQNAKRPECVPVETRNDPTFLFVTIRQEEDCSQRFSTGSDTWEHSQLKLLIPCALVNPFAVHNAAPTCSC
jgi:hypothetical protein